jgi:hypothetical protein
MTETTHHTPANVRERVAFEAFAWEHGRRGAAAEWIRAQWQGETPKRRAMYFALADRILAILRTPRVREPREYDTATEAIRDAQARADREGRTAFVWYRYCARWAVRDTEPTSADYAEGWMLAARAPARRSRVPLYRAALRSEAQGEDRWEDVVFGPITEAYNEAHAARRGEGGGE